jgi:hypothetical protein
MKVINEEHSPNCKCIICKDFNEFEIPKHLMDEIMEGKCVIFAGAGISTEKQALLPYTFFEEICQELGYENTKKVFPTIMTEYCNRPNGRIELLNKIRDRFKNLKSFPELYYSATLFHKELSCIPYLNTIVTTNWDTYFEDETYSIPFVTGEDCSFWDTKDRKVLKIHGSINNLGSIIITEKDYDECLSNLETGILGSILKTIIATKTIVFIGYSLRDYDFNSVYELINNELNKYSRFAYIVSLDRNFTTELKASNFKVICTDGIFFLRRIKEKLQEMDEMMYDEHLHLGEMLLKLIRISHKKLLKKYNYKDNPSIINMLNTVDSYFDIRSERLKSKNYNDVAYIDGYLIIHLMYFGIDEELRKNKNIKKKFKDFIPSLYYMFGYKEDINDEKQFHMLLKKSSELHKTSYTQAKRIIKKKIGDTNSMEMQLHHPNFL